jgi:signal peptide peptidase SppA
MNDLKNALNGYQPMLISPTKALSYADKVDKFQASGMDILTALFGEMPKPHMQGSVGIVPIVGVIGKGMSPIEKALGGCDVDDVAQAIHTFAKNKHCKTIMLDVSSPGGSVAGVPELASLVKAVSKHKKVVAFTDTECASAAYWVASQATSFLATPSAIVGSVGVYRVVPDTSKAYETQGIKMKVIKAGKYKAAGVAGTPLTKEQEDMMQDEVDDIHGSFKSDVKAVRIYAQDKDMEGQVFSGKHAATRGLITGLADNKSDAVEKLDKEDSEKGDEDDEYTNKEVEEENLEETKHLAKNKAQQDSEDEDDSDEEEEDDDSEDDSPKKK